MERDTDLCRQTTLDIRQIVMEAATWAVTLDTADETSRAAFVRWLHTSPRHVEEFLQMTSICRSLGDYAQRSTATSNPAFSSEPKPQTHTKLLEKRDPDSAFVALLSVLTRAGGPEHALYMRYRSPILRLFLHRGIQLDIARSLMQLVLVRAIKEFRAKGIADPSLIGASLYRISCNIARTHTRNLMQERTLSCDDVIAVSEEARSLEERIDSDLLARSVRTMLRCLSETKDREVLTRFYLREEPRNDICRALSLSAPEFNQVLWRARQRFAEVLRRNGLRVPASRSEYMKNTHVAARYVADDLDFSKKQRFELQMIQDSSCNQEVDLWSTIKHYMQTGGRARKPLVTTSETVP